MTDQEMQMMLLMSAARGGNKNLSGVLGNMDNQLLAIMAGAYDPRTAEQSGPGASSYWSRYSQSEDPVIQDVIAKITSGADKYQINSYIDSLAAQGQDLGAFQVSDLKGVATELYKEFTGTGSSGSSSSKNKSVTQKAGIPDPTELYNTSTVPLSSMNEQYIRKLQEDLMPKVKGYETVSSQVGVARKNLERGSSATDAGKRIKTADVLKWFDEESSRGRGTLGLNRARSYFKNNPVDDISSSDLTGLLTKTKGEAYKYRTGSYEAKRFDEATKNIGKKTGSARGVGYNKEANKKYDDAMLQKVTMEAMMSAANQREQAVREGQMDYARQSGATPTTDAMKMIMKFISSSK